MMGTGFSSVRQQLPKVRNFNAANRALRAEKAKPPTHKSHAAALNQFKTQNPDLFMSFVKESSAKDQNLEANLKSVFVKSEGDNPIIETKKAKALRSLPQVKPEESHETAVPKGKLTIVQLFELLQKYNDGSSLPLLASKLRISESDLRDVIKYCSLLDVVVDRPDYEPYSPEVEQLDSGDSSDSDLVTPQVVSALNSSQFDDETEGTRPKTVLKPVNRFKQQL